MEANKLISEESSLPKALESMASPTVVPPGEPLLKEGDGGEDLGSKPGCDGTEVASGAASDLEKKVRRAERFGITVMLSEEEKRNSRAERFGTGATSSGTGTTDGKLEEQKRKARAERFGLAAPSESKKARLERFAQNSKPDTIEEEKRKAREARFSQTSVPSTATEANAELPGLVLS
ncbi:hypothetical protein J5N97_013656 [Dioscorea zingiberensis]|uniref:THO1-MOS11 C-terminal domain-containing protein n=1 Tax=Dioscorea zingiberensis TaxID=325984 RepID=A0A9D5HJA5_9LILI|nr:hypothetical protein J5N97_013656 [Dioscorea zingiberensis]